MQAGHFNDFLFVSLLRAATLAAVRSAGPMGLGDDEIGNKVQTALGFRPEATARRGEWMLDPEAKGVGQIKASKTLARVLAHRVWADQRRGWRFTNPNLEELGLFRAEYLSLDDLAMDAAAFADAPPDLRDAPPDIRKRALTILLDAMRHGLAVTTDALDPAMVDEIGSASRQALREPWSLGQQERQLTAAALMIEAPKREQAGVRGEPLIVRGGPRSALAEQLNLAEIWGLRLPAKDYVDLVQSLLSAAESYELVRSVTTTFDVVGWQVAANAIRFTAGTAAPTDATPTAIL